MEQMEKVQAEMTALAYQMGRDMKQWDEFGLLW